MDEQNLNDHASHICDASDNLSKKSKLKFLIQNEVYQLQAALKKRELALLTDVDLHFLGRVSRDGPTQNSSMQLEFQSNFEACKQQLENYGQLTEGNSSNKTACESQMDKNQLPKGQTGKDVPVDEMDPLKESFVFVDSVKCLSLEKAEGKCQVVTATLPKTAEDNLSEKEEVLSCCSVDSFDVIQTDCCGMNDFASAKSKLPSTPAAHQASGNKSNSGYPTFYLPNLQERERNKENEWIHRAITHLPKGKPEEPAEERESVVLPVTLEANVSRTAWECPEKRKQDEWLACCSGTEKSFISSTAKEDPNVLLIPSNVTETACDECVVGEEVAWVKKTMGQEEEGMPSSKKLENQSVSQGNEDTPAKALRASFKAYLHEKDLHDLPPFVTACRDSKSRSVCEGNAWVKSENQKNGGTPANALQASFGAYLREGELRAWVHRKGGSDYEQWVAKSPSIKVDISDAAIVNAFTRQLKSFAMQ